jgi:hypothetical protein
VRQVDRSELASLSGGERKGLRRAASGVRSKKKKKKKAFAAESLTRPATILIAGRKLDAYRLTKNPCVPVPSLNTPTMSPLGFTPRATVIVEFGTSSVMKPLSSR